MANPMAIKKVNWWHESLVDWELANPHKLLGDCALEFNVTQAWLSQVRNSDAYKEYRAERRAEHNGNVSMTIVERTEKLAGLVLEEMTRRVETEREALDFDRLESVANLALKSLGFGNGNSKTGQPLTAQNNISNTTNTIIVTNGADIERAREKMRAASAMNTLEGNAQKVEVISDANDSRGSTAREAVPAAA